MSTLVQDQPLKHGYPWRLQLVPRWPATWRRICNLFAPTPLRSAVVEIVTNAPRPDGGRKFAPKDKDRVLAYFEELLPDGQSSGEFGSFATLPLDLVPIAGVGLLIMMLVLMNEAVKRHGRRAKRDTSGI